MKTNLLCSRKNLPQRKTKLAYIHPRIAVSVCVCVYVFTRERSKHIEEIIKCTRDEMSQTYRIEGDKREETLEIARQPDEEENK